MTNTFENTVLNQVASVSALAIAVLMVVGTIALLF